MLRNTIRHGIGTIHLADHLNARLHASGLPRRETNLSMMIDTGKQCTFSGKGESFKDYKRTGYLRGFTGYGEKPALSKDPHYSEALLRFMSLADTYGNDEYKKSEILDIYLLKKYTELYSVNYCVRIHVLH